MSACPWRSPWSSSPSCWGDYGSPTRRGARLVGRSSGRRAPAAAPPAPAAPPSPVRGWRHGRSRPGARPGRADVAVHLGDARRRRSSLAVQFWGGVEDCYRYTVRAKETRETVTLTLDEKTTFDGACIEPRPAVMTRRCGSVGAPGPGRWWTRPPARSCLSGPRSRNR